MSLSKDDDSTVIRSGTTVPTAGHTASGPSSFANSAGTDSDGLSLCVGTRVAEFEVTERIGEGGFSIVYLAMDHSLERIVALKEYMPSSLASRLGNTQVQPRSQRYRDTFEMGLKSFVNEAKLLAQFDHPALVKVYRFWEANGTAYMVMPFYQGSTVKDTVRAMPAPPDEAWLMALLAPLTEALAVIHGQQCYHRDIAPDNVILLAGSGSPLLLDFGAARRVIGDMTQALTVILKAGYAPVEQYAEVPGMKQGPWTDVYALAAVVYWAITGKTPPPSVGRMVNDAHVPLMECAAGRYSASFLQAIDRALVVLPDRRTPSVEALRRDLGIESIPARHPSDPAWTNSDATVIRPTPSTLSGRAAGTTARPTIAPVTSSELSATLDRRPQADATQASPAQEAGGRREEPEATRRGVKPAMVAGMVVALALVGLGLWWSLQPNSIRESPASTPLPTPAAAAAVVAEPGPRANPEPVAVPLPPAPPPLPSPEAAPKADIEAVPRGGSVLPPPPPPAATPEATLPPPATRPSAQKQVAAQSGRAKTEPKPPQAQNTADNSAECARILAKLSLGESRPELTDRFKQLNCR
jgi:serine/threonine protein kinase